MARAPGRVNIIGEHMDYCGYVVLPMAIEQDVAIACPLSGTQNIRFSNVEPSPQITRVLPWTLPLGRKLNCSGISTCCVATKGTLEEARLENHQGMDLLVDGSIPPSSGLSSSSALVCCVALVMVYANKLDNFLDTKRLVELHMHAVHYIGTEGGV